MPIKKKTIIDIEAILEYMDDWEDEIDRCITEGEGHEFKDYDHFLVEAVIEAIYEDKMDFWNKSNKVSY